MVPSFRKEKPPTPPKPIHYQPVNYKRLVDGNFTRSSHLQIEDRSYDSKVHRSLTDDTAPLIDVEPAKRRSAVPILVKPPLLPKPHLIPRKLVVAVEESKKCTNPFVAMIERRECKQSTNPFDDEQSEVRSTNPFECNSANYDSVTSNYMTKFSETIRTSHVDPVSSNSLLEIGVCSHRSSNEAAAALYSSELHENYSKGKECLLEGDGIPDTLFKNANRDKSNQSSWRSSTVVEVGEEVFSTNESLFWGKESLQHNGRTTEIESKVEDEDSQDSSSDNSFSVGRRIKTWFGSFGKAGKAARRKSITFYVEPQAPQTNIWETASLSSFEEKNDQNEDLVTVHQNGNDYQIALNGDISRESLTDSEKKKRKALCIIKELISSEKVFINVLKLLTEDFFDYVKYVDLVNPIIPETEVKKILDYLPPLKSFNETLLEDFEKRLENWSSWPKIADIFIKKGPFLKLFSTYIQHFEEQCSLLDECCHKYSRFNKALKDFEASDQCKKLTLKHYMLKPVQRLPQYKLLLEDYLHQQDDECIDYKDTQQALKIVCEAADHANRRVAEYVHLGKLLQLQAQLGNYEIIKPGREFVKAGELYKLSRKSMRLRYFILLNDCLLCTIYYGSLFRFTVKYKLPLSGMKVCTPTSEDYHNEFIVISTTRSFTLRARSNEEREQWVSQLEKTIQEYNRKQLSFTAKFIPQTLQAEPLEIGKEAPVWVPDARVTMCQVCTAEFNLTFRRHHCRACGKVVCANCSDKKAPLQYKKFNAARVCDECYQYLLKEYTDTDSSIMKYIMEQSDLSETDAATLYNNIISSFKKHDPHRPKKLPTKNVPSRLKEVSANDSGSLISSWLHRKMRKTWKRYWFVLKKQVLYMYKASNDVKALEAIPVLGYVLETFKECSSTYEEIDSKLVFQLAHVNQPPLVFYAETESIAEKWIVALKEGVSMT